MKQRLGADRVERLEPTRTRAGLLDAKAQETVAIVVAVLLLIVILAATLGLAWRVFCFGWGRC